MLHQLRNNFTNIISFNSYNSPVKKILSSFYCACAQSCMTLCSPMDCNPPGSSVHGIFQSRTLEGVARSSSRGFPNPGIERVSLLSPALAGRFFTTSTTILIHEARASERLSDLPDVIQLINDKTGNKP